MWFVMLLLTYWWASLKARALVSAFCSRFLHQATKLYDTTIVVPVNHVLFTTSAVIAGERRLSILQWSYPTPAIKQVSLRVNDTVRESLGYKDLCSPQHIVLTSSRDWISSITSSRMGYSALCESSPGLSVSRDSAVLFRITLIVWGARIIRKRFLILD